MHKPTSGVLHRIEIQASGWPVQNIYIIVLETLLHGSGTMNLAEKSTDHHGVIVVPSPKKHLLKISDFDF